MVIDANQKILLINSVLCESLEFKKENVIGRDYWEVFRDSELNAMIRRVLEEKVHFEKEHKIQLSDLVFQVHLSPVASDSEFLGAIAVFHDVTRLKNLERMRSEFVANVSHELKTPLTSILGFVETLKEGAVDDVENRMKFLNVIEEHSHKLHRLIEDLLLLSKLESAEIPVRLEKIDLEALVHNLSESLAPQMKIRKIRFHIRTDNHPFWVNTDRTLLEQVLTNILANAVNYNKEGGSIAIELNAKTDVFQILVKDTGIGISSADLPHIFERFYRADKSRSRETGGTGLGLSIAKHMVEKQGGRLSVESQEGQGSTFKIELPLR